MRYSSIIQELKDKGIILGDDIVGYKVNPYLEMPKSLAFSDVALDQDENICTSRLDTNISSEVARGLKIKAPFLSANMSSVSNGDFCVALNKCGGLGVLHRAWPNVDDYLTEVRKVASECEFVAASIGANISDLELADRLVGAGANVIVVDIAQGFSRAVMVIGEKVKRKYPHVKMILGNVINPRFMYKVDEFADAVKIGIGMGSACLTKNTAGATAKMFDVVCRFKDISKKLGLPVISDGSISEPADAVKAVAAGANSVMMGKVFARCPESAAETIEIDGTAKKIYAGMASRYVQDRWRGGLKPGTCPEGKALYLDLGEPVSALVERYSGALRSGLTYAGAQDIKTFQEKARFVRL